MTSIRMKHYRQVRARASVFLLIQNFIKSDERFDEFISLQTETSLNSLYKELF